MAQNAVVQDRQGASVLVADISGEALVGDLVELEADVIDRVAAVTIGRYDSTLVVESELVFEAVPKGRLVEGHVGLEQFEVQRHEEAVSIRVGDGLVDGIVLSVSCADTNFGRVSVGSSVNSLVLGVLPLSSGLPEVLIAVIYVAVIDRHHLVAGDFNGQFFDRGVAYILDQGPIGVGRGQRNGERQFRGSGHDNVIAPQIWEADQQLLVLINRRRVVGDNN